jgi:Ankyrin repeats (3 copies)
LQCLHSCSQQLTTLLITTITGKAGWESLSKWLKETRACGDAGIYTYADLQAERTIAVASTTLLEAIAHSGAPCKDGALPGTVTALSGGHAPPDLETEEGHTALMSACYSGGAGCAAAVSALLAQGCDPCYANANGRTPLMAAAAAGNAVAVAVLLRAGADAAAQDVQGCVAAQFAREGGHGRVTHLLALAAKLGSAAACSAEDAEVAHSATTAAAQQHEALLVRLGGGSIDTAASELELMQQLQSTVEQQQQQGSSLMSDSVVTLETGDVPVCDSNSLFSSSVSGSSSSSSGSSSVLAGAHQRCPKCTLPLPCRHYADTHELLHDYPGGVPEWRWSRKAVGNSRRVAALARAKAEKALPQWRKLHKGYREHVVFAAQRSAAQYSTTAAEATASTTAPADFGRDSCSTSEHEMQVEQ